MFIYKIINKINGKIYIGQTRRTIERRWYYHCYSKGKDRHTPLHNAIEKYGKDNFIIEIIETCNSFEELNEREIYWIAFLNSKSPSGYNVCTGGQYSDTRTGKKHKPETIEKMRKAATGEGNSQYGKKGHLAATFGKKCSPEHCRKNGAAHSKAIICVTTGEIFESGRAAAKKYGILSTGISAVIRGKNKTCGGLVFKFLEEKDGNNNSDN